MLRLASDADVHGDIIRGLRRRAPAIDLVRVQDSLPEGTSENRVLITNDRNSMVGVAYSLVSSGQPAPGVIATTNAQSIGMAIEDLLLIAEFLTEEEIKKRG